MTTVAAHAGPDVERQLAKLGRQLGYLRRRSPFGIWFNDTSSGMVQIRKLFTSTRFKISEQSSGLRRS